MRALYMLKSAVFNDTKPMFINCNIPEKKKKTKLESNQTRKRNLPVHSAGHTSMGRRLGIPRTVQAHLGLSAA